MKVSSFYKPVVRQWTKLTSKIRASSSATSVSRASSVSSTATPKRMSSIGSMTSEDSFSSHFAAVGQEAQLRAYKACLSAGLKDPAYVASVYARNAVDDETRRVNGLQAAVGEAERAQIKAKHSLATTTLQLRQAQRNHGATSAEARNLAAKQKAAVDQLRKASADLYLAKIAF